MSEENKTNEQQEDCTHDCSSCSSSCSSKPKDLHEPQNQYSNVRHVIAVVSGKGGVGKSFVTSALAAGMAKQGYSTAVLDADVTGPSIPQYFGVHTHANATEVGLLPETTSLGIDIMSVNLLLDTEDTPVAWRGPVIAGTVKQFWSQVIWGDVDYMFVDMPPGTGDVPLTVFQSLPVDGIVVVTSPQDLVSMIVGKAVNMAKLMNIPIIGLVENYSYVECPDCKKRIYVFGESKLQETAEHYKLDVLAQLPLDPAISALADAGRIEDINSKIFETTINKITEQFPVEHEGMEDTRCYVIAVPADADGKVNSHFGSCTSFKLYAVVDGTVTDEADLETPGTGHEETANALLASGAKVVLCNGIGLPAMQLLLESDVVVVPGVKEETAAEAVQAYLNGELSIDGAPQSTCSSCGSDCGSGSGCSGCSGCH